MGAEERVLVLPGRFVANQTLCRIVRCEISRFSQVQPRRSFAPNIPNLFTGVRCNRACGRFLHPLRMRLLIQMSIALSSIASKRFS